MIQQEAFEKAKDELIYGIQGKFVKRRGQIDAQTVKNKDYVLSKAHRKYVMYGSKGHFLEKDMLPWHANIDQTTINR